MGRSLRPGAVAAALALIVLVGVGACRQTRATPTPPPTATPAPTPPPTAHGSQGPTPRSFPPEIEAFIDGIRDWAPLWPWPQSQRPSNLDLAALPSLPGEFQPAQFIPPATCRTCHADIYSQWKGSMHGLALQDPIFQELSKHFLAQVETDAQRKEAQTCVRCHTPAGHLTGEIVTSEGDYDAVSAPFNEGVFCDFCHSVKASAGIGNAPFVVEPGNGPEAPGVKRGPFKDAQSPYHSTEYSDLHTRAEFCGMCHEVAHVSFGTPIERTSTEWRSGPYNTGDPATTVPCQGCQMRPRPGIPATGSTARPDNPDQAALGGPQPPLIVTHCFVGGNSAVPALDGERTDPEGARDPLRVAAPRPGVLNQGWRPGGL